MSASPVVAVAPVGSAGGARTLGAALACRASGADRAALLVDLGRGTLRPTPVATSAARALEERLAAHLPGVPVASRGATCHLAPGRLGGDAGRGEPGPESGEPDGGVRAPQPEALRAAAAALSLVRDSAAVLLLPPGLLLPLADEDRMGLTAALLRAELPRDRSLTALATGELVGRGLRVAVAKRAPGRGTGALALLGAPVRGGVPDRVAERVLAPRAERDEG